MATDRAGLTGTARGDLEALRGAAALVVAVFHSLLWLKVGDAAQLPMQALWAVEGPQAVAVRSLLALFNGAMAVDVFFVLSGFALAAAFGAVPLSWRGLVAFGVRRCWRLWPTYAVSLAIVAFYLTVWRGAFEPWPRATGWMAQFYRTPSPVEGWFDNLWLVRVDLNPVAWTLRIEFVMSACLPWVCASARRLGGVLACVQIVLAAGVAMFCRYDEAGHFLYMFLLGAYAQRFQEVVMHVLPRWLRGGRLPTLGLAAMVLPGFWTLEHHPGADASISLGAVALVLWLARPSRGAVRWSWPWRALRGCGQVAYSFYLCHFVVLYAVAWSAQGWLPGALLVTAPLAVLVGVAAVALPMAMLLALALYAGVERPSSRLGRRVARWIVGRRGAAGVPQPAPRRGSFSIRVRKASTRRPDDGSPEGR